MVVDEPNSDPILARSSEALKAFVMTDLELGFQFANSALFHRQQGNFEHRDRCRQAALRVIRDVSYFDRRLGPKDYWVVARLRRKLASLIWHL